jgi:hypothetical protein
MLEWADHEHARRSVAGEGGDEVRGEGPETKGFVSEPNS